MHMRRQLRETLASVLEGIEGARVLLTHRVSVAAALAEQGSVAVMVYPVADMPPVRASNANQGARPTWRGFAFGVAVVATDEDAEDGRLDEVSAEVERRVFAEAGPLRALATRDIVNAGGETSVVDVSDRAVALVTVVELHVPMREGVPDAKG